MERQLRSFTDEYKRQAVELALSSGRSIGSVPRNSVCATRYCGTGLTSSGRSQRRGAPLRGDADVDGPSFGDRPPAPGERTPLYNIRQTSGDSAQRVA